MNDKYVVRVIRSEIRNLKNVNFGRVDYMNYGSVNGKGELLKTDIVGIYGQNGSGKTALVEALDILRYIIKGSPIPFDVYEGILSKDNQTCIVTDFYIEKDDLKYKVNYVVALEVNEEQKNIAIVSEKITYWIRGSSWKSERDILFENPYYNSDNLLENQELSIISNHISSFNEIPFLKNMQNLALICSQKFTSVFFNVLVRGNIMKLDGGPEVRAFKDIIMGIMQFGLVDLKVIKINQLGTIHNNQVIPINVYRETESSIMQGIMPLNIVGKSEISEKDFKQVEEAIDAVNIAMKSIVSNLQIELGNRVELEKPDGTKLIQVDVLSNRDGRRFLIRYESEGIKRIVSILNYLISVYNNKGVCLVIDELDSGIYEYLLGELLGLMKAEMKGQLIFTSHNLRVLEKLDSNNIICSTINPNNRYIQLTGIAKNNNKRDFYIRAITVGGQKEGLYNEEDLIAMGYAFRKAGRNVNRENKLSFSGEIEEKHQNLKN